METAMMGRLESWAHPEPVIVPETGDPGCPWIQVPESQVGPLDLGQGVDPPPPTSWVENTRIVT